MTATALAHNPRFDPQLDYFDDTLVPARPQLRLIQGGAQGTLALAPAVADIEVYRRRRFFALVATTVLILGLAWSAGISVMSFGGSSSAAVPAEAPAVHIVRPGDSYGAIAAELGMAQPALAAQQLQAANGGAELVVGQRIVIDLASLSAG